MNTLDTYEYGSELDAHSYEDENAENAENAENEKNFETLAKYPSFQELEYNEKKILIDQITELFKKGTNERWLVSEEEINIGKKIGEGSNSVIHDCEWRGIHIVVKMTKTKKLALLINLLQEIELWSALRHPNLVQFLGFSYSFKQNEFMILMEKIDGVNLAEFMEKKVSSTISDFQKYHICNQLINVFKFLHSCKPPVIYRDLKPENIMIDKFYNVKLTDFGLSRYMPEVEPYEMTGGTGTVRYMAPEVYFGHNYDLRADIYSLGLIIYYVFCGNKPFKDYNKESIKTYFTNKDLLFSTKQVKEPKLRSIINNCIEKECEDRWDINQLATNFVDIIDTSNRINCTIS